MLAEIVQKEHVSLKRKIINLLIINQPKIEINDQGKFSRQLYI